jgi:uncharacterized protein
MPINRITPKIPIEMNDDGVYEYLYSDDLTAVIDQNLKMILLTRKGERMMNPAFGAGLHDFLFENPTNQVLTTIKNIISNQIRLYATYITVNDIQIVYSGESSINISIRYTIDENSTSAVFEITI